PPELLAQLQTLAQRGAAGLRGAVLQSAKYQGAIVDAIANFEAEFQAHSFSERTVLQLPLSGVELREILVDGSEAYPSAAPQSGYSLKLQGGGPHTIRVRFGVRIAAGGADQDMRFGLPELAQSQLTLLAPQGARYLQAISARGAQRISMDPGGVRLEADLGRVSSLIVHWRQP